ncbi:unnamed protein product [Prorocentrum cordatum]|uniref:Phospholipase B-like n=1 Tax=Prorocentrum cordatum TaxID=2364126 RepID=A0ABN9WT57_9DINO|nr:unnamed protein product [Polarella glacialis]
MAQHDAETMAFYQAHVEDLEAVYMERYPDAHGEMRVLWEALDRHASGEEQRAALSWPRVFLAQLHMQITNIGPRLGECTSVVAQLPTGMLHARNWDFGPEPGALGTASVSVDFHSSGTGNFTCLLALTHIAKWTTCVKPRAFSMSLNARGFGDGHERGRTAAEELRLLRQGHLPRVEVLRRVMRAESFGQAVGVAAASRPLTSMYVILGAADPREGGAVVTLEGNGSSADVMPMPGPAEADGWFLVQTNADHWVPMSQGAYSSHRREHVRGLMRALGPSATPEQVLGVLQDATEYPAGNAGPDDGAVFRNSTIASVLMSPGSGGACAASYRPLVWRALPGPGPAPGPQPPQTPDVMSFS